MRPRAEALPAKVLRNLTHLARAWGGDILSVTPKEFDTYCWRKDFAEAPFVSGSLGCNYAKKTIVFVPGDDINWSGLTHEMGHCFASRVKPEDANEGDFTGWEYRLARKVGSQKDWLFLNKGYSLDYGYDIGYYLKNDPKELRRKLKQLVLHSKELGLLDAALNPIAVR